MACCGIVASSAAHAQPAASGAAPAWPMKPVRVVVSSTAGGGSDFVGRLLAQKLTDALGQQFIVDNRPGGGGMLGIDFGMKAAPDGYTFNLITPSYDVANWHALIGPKGVARAVVDRLNGEVMKIIRSKEMEERMRSDGVGPAGSTPEELQEQIRRELTLWRTVVQAAGIKIQ
jgi:tripartite-type tricarboxylate transporter receptor subunit TctC